jgi:hypothetical protein
MTCRGTGLFRALRADHILFPGSLTRKLYKKKIPEMIPGVPGTKGRELAGQMGNDIRDGWWSEMVRQEESGNKVIVSGRDRFD